MEYERFQPQSWLASRSFWVISSLVSICRATWLIILVSKDVEKNGSLPAIRSTEPLSILWWNGNSGVSELSMVLICLLGLLHTGLAVLQIWQPLSQSRELLPYIQQLLGTDIHQNQMGLVINGGSGGGIRKEILLSEVGGGSLMLGTCPIHGSNGRNKFLNEENEVNIIAAAADSGGTSQDSLLPTSTKNNSDDKNGGSGSRITTKRNTTLDERIFAAVSSLTKPSPSSTTATTTTLHLQDTNSFPQTNYNISHACTCHVAQHPLNTPFLKISANGTFRGSNSIEVPIIHPIPVSRPLSLRVASPIEVARRLQPFTTSLLAPYLSSSSAVMSPISTPVYSSFNSKNTASRKNAPTTIFDLTSELNKSETTFNSVHQHDIPRALVDYLSEMGTPALIEGQRIIEGIRVLSGVPAVVLTSAKGSKRSEAEFKIRSTLEIYVRLPVIVTQSQSPKASAIQKDLNILSDEENLSTNDNLPYPNLFKSDKNRTRTTFTKQQQQDDSSIKNPNESITFINSCHVVHWETRVQFNSVLQIALKISSFLSHRQSFLSTLTPPREPLRDSFFSHGALHPAALEARRRQLGSFFTDVMQSPNLWLPCVVDLIGAPKRARDLMLDVHEFANVSRMGVDMSILSDRLHMGDVIKHKYNDQPQQIQFCNDQFDADSITNDDCLRVGNSNVDASLSNFDSTLVHHNTFSNVPQKMALRNLETASKKAKDFFSSTSKIFIRPAYFLLAQWNTESDTNKSSGVDIDRANNNNMGNTNTDQKKKKPLIQKHNSSKPDKSRSAATPSDSLHLPASACLSIQHQTHDGSNDNCMTSNPADKSRVTIEEQAFDIIPSCLAANGANLYLPFPAVSPVSPLSLLSVLVSQSAALPPPSLVSASIFRSRRMLLLNPHPGISTLINDQNVQRSAMKSPFWKSSAAHPKQNASRSSSTLKYHLDEFKNSNGDIILVSSPSKTKRRKDMNEEDFNENYFPEDDIFEEQDHFRHGHSPHVEGPLLFSTGLEELGASSSSFSSSDNRDEDVLTESASSIIDIPSSKNVSQTFNDEDLLFSHYNSSKVKNSFHILPQMEVKRSNKRKASSSSFLMNLPGLDGSAMLAAAAATRKSKLNMPFPQPSSPKFQSLSNDALTATPNYNNSNTKPTRSLENSQPLKKTNNEIRPLISDSCLPPASLPQLGAIDPHTGLGWSSSIRATVTGYTLGKCNSLFHAASNVLDAPFFSTAILSDGAAFVGDASGRFGSKSSPARRRTIQQQQLLSAVLGNGRRQSADVCANHAVHETGEDIIANHILELGGGSRKLSATDGNILMSVRGGTSNVIIDGICCVCKGKGQLFQEKLGSVDNMQLKDSFLSSMHFVDDDSKNALQPHKFDHQVSNNSSMGFDNNLEQGNDFSMKSPKSSLLQSTSSSQFPPISTKRSFSCPFCVTFDFLPCYVHGALGKDSYFPVMSTSSPAAAVNTNTSPPLNISNNTSSSVPVSFQNNNSNNITANVSSSNAKQSPSKIPSVFKKRLEIETPISLLNLSDSLSDGTCPPIPTCVVPLSSSAFPLFSRSDLAFTKDSAFIPAAASDPTLMGITDFFLKEQADLLCLLYSSDVDDHHHQIINNDSNISCAYKPNANLSSVVKALTPSSSSFSIIYPVLVECGDIDSINSKSSSSSFVHRTSIYRRFSDFLVLEKTLNLLHAVGGGDPSCTVPPLPKSFGLLGGLITRQSDRANYAARQAALNKWLNEVIAIPVFHSAPLFAFLGLQDVIGNMACDPCYLSSFNVGAIVDQFAGIVCSQFAAQHVDLMMTYQLLAGRNSLTNINNNIGFPKRPSKTKTPSSNSNANNNINNTLSAALIINNQQDQLTSYNHHSHHALDVQQQSAIGVVAPSRAFTAPLSNPIHSRTLSQDVINVGSSLNKNQISQTGANPSTRVASLSIANIASSLNNSNSANKHSNTSSSPVFCSSSTLNNKINALLLHGNQTVIFSPSSDIKFSSSYNNNSFSNILKPDGVSGGSHLPSFGVDSRTGGNPSHAHVVYNYRRNGDGRLAEIAAQDAESHSSTHNHKRAKSHEDNSLLSDYHGLTVSAQSHSSSLLNSSTPAAGYDRASNAAVDDLLTPYPSLPLVSSYVQPTASQLIFETNLLRTILIPSAVDVRIPLVSTMICSANSNNSLNNDSNNGNSNDTANPSLSRAGSLPMPVPSPAQASRLHYDTSSLKEASNEIMRIVVSYDLPSGLPPHTTWKETLPAIEGQDFSEGQVISNSKALTAMLHILKKNLPTNSHIYIDAANEIQILPDSNVRILTRRTRSFADLVLLHKSLKLFFGKDIILLPPFPHASKSHQILSATLLVSEANKQIELDGRSLRAETYLRQLASEYSLWGIPILALFLGVPPVFANANEVVYMIVGISKSIRCLALLKYQERHHSQILDKNKAVVNLSETYTNADKDDFIDPPLPDCELSQSFKVVADDDNQADISLLVPKQHSVEIINELGTSCSFPLAHNEEKDILNAQVEVEENKHQSDSTDDFLVGKLDYEVPNERKQDKVQIESNDINMNNIGHNIEENITMDDIDVDNVKDEIYKI